MNRKNHYQILGLTPEATHQQIQHSFHRLSNLYHPDKNPDDRITCQHKFNQICEAFFTLSNPEIRASYDQLLQGPSLDTALDLMLKFFQLNGFQDQFQKDSFDKLYPDRDLNYYQILGIPVNSNSQQIQRAFRKLSILYHPMNNPQDQAAERKFIKICQAYNQLYDNCRKSFYDDYKFKKINNGDSLNYFNKHFTQNSFGNKQDQQFFGQLIRRQSSKNNQNKRILSPFEKIQDYQKRKLWNHNHNENTKESF